MLTFFKEQKEKVTKFLSDYIKEQSLYLKKIHNLGLDVCERLLKFIERGKMLRAGVAALGYKLFSSKTTTELIKIGAVLELLQSALLVHDDIMDRDQARRGIHTIFYQYAQLAKKQKLTDAYHMGQSLGICAGDMGFFLAFALLADLKVSKALQKRVLTLCSREMSYVVTAQMADVSRGASEEIIDENAIIDLYRFKTGRYTFSLPLVLGALLTQADEVTLKVLEEIGENMGIVFQLKDDELGLFSDQEVLGKPIGSDIKEGKKTLYYSYLFKLASSAQKKKIKAIYGNSEILQQDIHYIRDLVIKLGVKEKVQNKLLTIIDKVKSLIEKLNIKNKKAREIFLKLIDYNLKRKK